MGSDEILDEGEEAGDGVLLQLPVREGGGGHQLPVLQGIIAVLRSRSYLFSAPTPAPPLSPISAPAPAIYCHLKLFYNSSTIAMEVEISFSSS